MTIQRRGFLAGILAAASAPAIVSAGSMMKIIVPPQDIILPGSGFIKMPDVWHGLGADFDGDTIAFTKEHMNVDIGNGDFTVEWWTNTHTGHIDEIKVTKPRLYDQIYKKPLIPFMPPDKLPHDGKWTHVSLGPDGYKLSR